MEIKKNKPMFVVFEGIDGSGKTTISKMLQDMFDKRGYKTLWLREPSDSIWGKKIRELANLKDAIPIEEELNYFIEDRKIDLKHNIGPALEQGKIVILDRYYYSNGCYQGARGLDVNKIIEKNLEFALTPDLTFIIDLPVDVALYRIKNNREETAILFEKKDYLERVRSNYLNLSFPEIKVIDGNDSIEGVFAKIKTVFDLI